MIDTLDPCPTTRGSLDGTLLALCIFFMCFILTDLMIVFVAVRNASRSNATA